ncbi:MAG: MFS transporter [Dehalococcoidia bacterium]|nr:MFS transporter [Dehalococcoidia bacterium]
MLSRPFVVLFVAMFVAMAGISMVSPLLPVYVQDDLGGPAVGVALSFSGLALAQLAFAPFFGRLGDSYGAKRFIVLGFAIYAAGAVGYLFATNWETVVGFRILSGVGAAAMFPMSMAYIGRMAPVGGEGRYMGWFSVAQIAGFGTGPLFGGGLRDLFSSDFAFGSMAVMLGGTALLTLLLLPRDRPEAPGAGLDGAPQTDARRVETVLPFRVLIRRPAVQASTLFVLITSLGWGTASSWLAVYVISDEGLGTDSALFVGILLSSRSLINAVLQPYTGGLADRMSRVMLVVVGLSVAGIAQGVVPLLPDSLTAVDFFGEALIIAPWLLAALLMAGIAESLAFPSQQAIFVQIGRKVGMGSIMGINAMGSSAGFLSGSLIGAVIKTQFGIDSVFYFAGIASLVGVGVFVLLMRRAADDLREDIPTTLAATPA